MTKYYEHIGVCRLELPSKISIFPGQKFQAELPQELESFLINIEAIKSIDPPTKSVAPRGEVSLKAKDKE